MPNKYITVAGSLNYDIIVKQKRLPACGETFTADSVTFAGGGKGANQAVQCSKLGVQTYMIGKVGDDNFGEYLMKELKAYGVSTDFVHISKENTGLGMVNVLEDGSVFATISTGANFDFTTKDIDKLEEVISKSSILILQLEIPTTVVEYVIDKARAAGVYIILNGAPAKEISAKALKQVDCLVLNESESSFYSNCTITDEDTARKYAKTLLDMVNDIVIITLGEKGSLLCEKNGSTFVPSFNFGEVVETTGAGDSYIGAFATAKLDNQSNVDACYFAAKVAAVTVTGLGAQPSMPDLVILKNNEII